MNKAQIIKYTKRKDKLLLMFALFLFSFTIVQIGGALNMTALAENNGRMPVYSTEDISTSTHFSFQDKKEINMFYFSDIFYLSSVGYYVSLGDFLIYIGFILCLVLSPFVLYRAVKLIKEDKKFKKEVSKLNRREKHG